MLSHLHHGRTLWKISVMSILLLTTFVATILTIVVVVCSVHGRVAWVDHWARRNGRKSGIRSLVKVWGLFHGENRYHLGFRYRAETFCWASSFVVSQNRFFLLSQRLNLTLVKPLVQGTCLFPSILLNKSVDRFQFAMRPPLNTSPTAQLFQHSRTDTKFLCSVIDWHMEVLFLQENRRQHKPATNRHDKTQTKTIRSRTSSRVTEIVERDKGETRCW